MRVKRWDHCPRQLCCCDSTAGWVAYQQETFISHSSGGWKSEIRVPAWLGSGEGSLLDCKRLPSPCVLTWWEESKLALWPLLIRALVAW